MRFSKERITKMYQILKELSTTASNSIEGFQYCVGRQRPDIGNPQWIEYTEDVDLSQLDEHIWFHKIFATPMVRDEIEILFELKTGREDNWAATNPQALVYLNGQIIQGMDTNHTEVLLEPDTEYEMYLCLYTGSVAGQILFLPSLVSRDKRIDRLYYDSKVALDAALCLDRDSFEYTKIIRTLEITAGLLDLRKPYSEAFYASIDKAGKYLQEMIYRPTEADHTEHKVKCVGHTHIDVAWLWTLSQTREKVVRSFATALNLMKQYPEYRFFSSQPQLYQFVKEEAPALYEKIKEMIRQGRWEADGAMWLEADCNITGGESLVRQFLYGKRFFREEFGIDSRILWLPDTFGYTAALPQIMLKCGVDWFVTSKISWNDTNQMPYDTFYWVGLDGSRVLSYFITARDKEQNWYEKSAYRTYYNGHIRPSQVMGTWKRYQQKEWNEETLLPFGFGDGGGGPTRDMLEQQRRLSAGLPGMPKTEMEPVHVFLKHTEQSFLENADKLHSTPEWTGELYLELHRGTYTSMALNKRFNRKCEFTFRLAELLCTMNFVLLGREYPRQLLRDSWQVILLNQFHDILPGSSIYEVYEESHRQYCKVLKTGERLVEDALQSIAERLETEGDILALNPHSFAADGYTNGIKVTGLPPLGWRVLKPIPQRNGIKVTERRLETDFYRIEIDEAGNLSSLFDKQDGRQVLAGAANQLQVFEDFSPEHDAWEIRSYYRQKMWTLDEADVSIIREGTRAGWLIQRRFQHSLISQKILLYPDSRRIDFETEIDWQEEHMLLKAAFPLAIHTNKATYDIQFGNIERPNHQNTSWDEARFEVCAHKWADLSEDDYGVSLLNDCKYGYNAQGNTLKLTLLKCATDPNPHADKGKHRFVYSLYPHMGGFREGGTIQEAYLLNQPVLSMPLTRQDGLRSQNGLLSDEYSFIRCDQENIVIETVKLAEESNDIIVRLYDGYNRRKRVELEAGFDFEQAYLCDMLENEWNPLQTEGRRIHLEVGNYEIVTIKIVLQGA